MEQDPKVLEDLEGLWSNGQIAVLKKALSAAAKSGVGLLEATEVVEPNPISPNESTSYSNLYHCDRDGVYLYIDAVSGQLADAIGKNEGRFSLWKCVGICGKNQNRQLPTILIIAEKLTVSVSFSAIFHNFFIATTGCRIDIGGVVEWLPQKK